MNRFKIVSTRKGVRLQKKVIEQPPQPLSIKKGLARGKIDEEVGDLYDLVADLSDTLALLLKSHNALYEALDTSSLPVEDKDLADKLVAKFNSITTSAELDYAKDPEGTIDTLMESQGKIGKIMKDIKGV